MNKPVNPKLDKYVFHMDFDPKMFIKDLDKFMQGDLSQLSIEVLGLYLKRAIIKGDFVIKAGYLVNVDISQTRPHED